MLNGGIQKTVDGARAGVVDQHVKAARLTTDTLHGCLDRGFIHDVADHGASLVTVLGNTGGDSLFVDVCGVDDRPFGNEFTHDGCTHSLGGTGNEGNLVIEFHGCSCWPDCDDRVDYGCSNDSRDKAGKHRPMRLSKLAHPERLARP